MNSQEKDLEEPGHIKSKVKIKTKMRIMKKRIFILLLDFLHEETILKSQE